MSESTDVSAAQKQCLSHNRNKSNLKKKKRKIVCVFVVFVYFLSISAEKEKHLQSLSEALLLSLRSSCPFCSSAADMFRTNSCKHKQRSTSPCSDFISTFPIGWLLLHYSACTPVATRGESEAQSRRRTFSGRPDPGTGKIPLTHSSFLRSY